MQIRLVHVARTDPEVLIGVRENDVLVHLAVLDPKRPRADVARRIRQLKQLGHEVEERPRAGTPVRRQVEEYLRCDRHVFDFEFELEGTPFQEKVWREVRCVRRRQTITYAQLAKRCGQPKAIRAVARANAQNPMALVVPCHRVVSSSGRAGTPWKEVLLMRECYEP